MKLISFALFTDFDYRKTFKNIINFYKYFIISINMVRTNEYSIFLSTF